MNRPTGIWLLDVVSKMKTWPLLITSAANSTLKFPRYPGSWPWRSVLICFPRGQFGKPIRREFFTRYSELWTHLNRIVRVCLTTNTGYKWTGMINSIVARQRSSGIGKIITQFTSRPTAALWFYTIYYSHHYRTSKSDIGRVLKVTRRP